MTIRGPVMMGVSTALCASLAGCVMQAFYKEPPATPLALTPQAEALVPVDTPVTFVWEASERASWYDFHIFDQTTRDIERYYREFLKPDSVCEDNTCRIEITLSMPVAEGHAWRVRAGNNAGNSEWTRNLFAVNGEAFDKPTAGKPPKPTDDGKPTRTGPFSDALELEEVELVDDDQLDVDE